MQANAKVCVAQWMNEWMNERTNERTNERNEWMKDWLTLDEKPLVVE